MLKKILSIFFILCLVFSLTVPCFADSSLRSVNNNRVQVFLYSDFYININGTSQGWGYILSFSSTHFVIRRGNTYPLTDMYIYINGDLIYTYSFSSADEVFTFDVEFGDFVNICNRPLTLYEFVNNTGQNLTFTYRSGVREFSTRYNFFFPEHPRLINNNNYVINGILYTEQTLYLNDSYTVIDPTDEVGRPILNFYSGLFHTFDFLPEITSTYLSPFIIVVGVISILVFIFVVVFMIKRFTGGKT